MKPTEFIEPGDEVYAKLDKKCTYLTKNLERGLKYKNSKRI